VLAWKPVRVGSTIGLWGSFAGAKDDGWVSHLASARISSPCLRSLPAAGRRQSGWLPARSHRSLCDRCARLSPASSNRRRRVWTGEPERPRLDRKRPAENGDSYHTGGAVAFGFASLITPSMRCSNTEKSPMVGGAIGASSRTSLRGHSSSPVVASRLRSPGSAPRMWIGSSSGGGRAPCRL
jgi:hypothetical protein